MAEYYKIVEFAEKWCGKFRDQNVNYIELVDHWMADECAALGFEMDCGKGFEEKYGRAVHDHKALEAIIDGVTDVRLLGSAIYSRWRYFNHWAYSGEDILQPENRAWFIFALSRLTVLGRQKHMLFTGTLRKVKIISNRLGYGLRPEPEDEVEQHLSINSNGKVWFSSYAYGEDGNKYKKINAKRSSISKDAANRIMAALSTYFGNEYIEEFATDIGDWRMEMTNTEGKVYKFRGSLCGEFAYEGEDISDMIRNALDMPWLYMFDGNAKSDIIQRIQIDYRRGTTMELGQSEGANGSCSAKWDARENLAIDRETGSVEHVRNVGSGCKISQKYEPAEGVAKLLDKFDADELFAHIEGNPPDVCDDQLETREYRIAIDYKRNPQKVITGTYDKKGLPDDWEEFIESVHAFMNAYGIGELFRSSNYKRVKRRKGEYIYCSVEFYEGGKQYYYLTDDECIEVGNLVMVPAGEDDHTAIVEVVKVERFMENDVPLPVEKTKWIVRKCGEGE